MELKELILEAWSNRELLQEDKYSSAVRAVIEDVDKGRLRTAAPSENGWVVNEWVKQDRQNCGGKQRLITMAGGMSLEGHAVSKRQSVPAIIPLL